MQEILEKNLDAPVKTVRVTWSVQPSRKLCVQELHGRDNGDLLVSLLEGPREFDPSEFIGTLASLVEEFEDTDPELVMPALADGLSMKIIMYFTGKLGELCIEPVE